VEKQEAARTEVYRIVGRIDAEVFATAGFQNIIAIAPDGAHARAGLSPGAHQ
jgi:hypothetical protein